MSAWGIKEVLPGPVVRSARGAGGRRAAARGAATGGASGCRGWVEPPAIDLIGEDPTCSISSSHPGRFIDAPFKMLGRILTG